MKFRQSSAFMHSNNFTTSHFNRTIERSETRGSQERACIRQKHSCDVIVHKSPSVLKNVRQIARVRAFHL